MPVPERTVLDAGLYADLKRQAGGCARHRPWASHSPAESISINPVGRQRATAGEPNGAVASGAGDNGTMRRVARLSSPLSRRAVRRVGFPVSTIGSVRLRRCSLC
jgi:hypothetical protein